MMKPFPQQITDSYIHYNWMPAVCDWAIDLPTEFYRGVGIKEPHQCPFPNPLEMKDGDRIFVKTDFLKNGWFQQQVMPHIKTRFTLVSGISSFSVDIWQDIVDNPLLIKWYSTNPAAKHEKIVGLPIGFEEFDRLGGNQDLIKKARQTAFGIDKTNRILLPYHTVENNPIRAAHIEHLKSLPFVEVQTEKLPFYDYLILLSRYRYCICLEGSGYDTHRNYECNLVDTVPIMISSPVRFIYEDWNLPGVFVDRWQDVDLYKYNYSHFRHGNVEQFLHTHQHINRILTNG